MLSWQRRAARLKRCTFGSFVGDSHRRESAFFSVVSGDLFVGHVAGRTALFVDDLISTGGTLLRAARAAGKAGARRVLALVTHGLFMPGAAAVLGDAAADRRSSPTPCRRSVWGTMPRGASWKSPRRRFSPRRSRASTMAAR
jgi:hypothetical protein